MPLKITQSLIWAEALANSTDPTDEDYELYGRDAIKHSYYACFHAALKWAKARGYQKPKKMPEHAGLWNWYSKDPNTQSIGTRGRSLHKKRTFADYKVDLKLTHDPVKTVEEAKELLDLIFEDHKRVKNDPDEQQIRVLSSTKAAATHVVAEAATS